MERELKICLDYSSNEYEREVTREDLVRLSSAIERVFGNDRVKLVEAYGYASVSDFVADDLVLVRRVSTGLRIPISCHVGERFTKSELQRVRFARLTIEGDAIDDDSDGNPLNRFPSLLCQNCNTPDESSLPVTFYVSARQMLRRRQDGVPDVPLPTKREIFSCSCGVFVVTERVKRILEALELPLKCAPVVPTPSKELPFVCWAMRPVKTWGVRSHVISSEPCVACGRLRRCHRNMDAESETLWENRLLVRQEAMPEVDFVCCETWFGDRTRRPTESFDFARDIFVSGKLYELLLRVKVRGLIPPEEFVAFEDGIPMAEDDTVSPWVNSRLELLKSKGLA